MDLAKYRAVFLEEAAEHLAEISSALLELEKDPARTEAVDVVFRMAHSIKGMAASLGYDSITDVAHRLEDRMQEIREAGAVGGPDELALIFTGLEGLEAMVAVVRETGEPPAPAPDLCAVLDRVARVAEAAPAERVAALAAPAVAKPARGEQLDAPTPPPSVRVSTEILDRFLSTVGEVILNSSQLRTSADDSQQAGSAGSAGFSAGLDRMDRVVGELQRRALELRTTKIQRIVEPLPRMAREIAKRANKRVEVEIAGADLELDRSILDRLSDPLVHILRNAVDHGVETPDVRSAAGKPATGHILIDAQRVKDTIRIAIRDDGAGIDLAAVRKRAVAAGLLHDDLADDLPPEELAAFVFHPGLSTASAVSEISGRGVGMDAVRATIESLGGRVEIATERGRGTTTTLVVPITAAVQRVLLLGVAGETIAIPIAKVERILEVGADEIERSGRESFALVDDEPIPVIALRERLAVKARSVPLAVGVTSAGQGPVRLVLADVRGERMALQIDEVVGQQQIYVKPVPELLAGLRVLVGLTITGEGRPVFLLDLNQVA